ncbi:acyl-CoA dehydrogenase family protein [Pararhodobacter marinus]|uniref:acyl-CoA dehydrogenase family protein n=1 Tax=Pararhodobacter marinus TaxID=2184063 RepID=UPI0035177381
MDTPFRFDPVDLPPEALALRAQVRDFLAPRAGAFSAHTKGLSWMGVDQAFSRGMAAEGWIGMTWPRAYGGRERSQLERYVVLEEMLAVGAPVGFHWIADRQSGPLILKLGTEAQKRFYLPQIASGEACFCIGLSEPDAGSDLAAIRTRLKRDGEGWRLSGRKIWTTNAHHSRYMIALVRSEGTAADRHKGLSQVIVPMDAPGVEIRQIRDMAGDAHFNEVTFDDVALPAEALIGTEGAGWAQATAELAYERSGPERYLSSFPLLAASVDAAMPGDRLTARVLGDAVADAAVLRSMSLAVAGMLDRGELPNNEAAVVKDIGVDFEQRLPEVARAVAGPGAALGDAGQFGALYQAVLQLAPAFSLRGGTKEIVRGIMARGLGLR